MSGLKIAAIGNGTCRELAERGIYADLVPQIFDGAALGAALARTCREGERILLPRAETGNREILDEISKGAGLSVDDVPTYTTVYESADYLDERQLFESGKIFCAVFTSASTVRGFAEATEGLDYSSVTAACIGKQTKAAADEYGMKTYMAKQADMECLVQLVEELWREERTGKKE